MTDEPKPQLSYAEVKNMKPAAVVQAARDGQLAELMSGRDPGRPEQGTRSVQQGARTATREGQLTRDALKTMSPEDIVRARTDGRLDQLLGR